jgi:hypothetical protein
MRFLGNAVVFVILYILFMLPTYFLPYLGSNSFVLSAAGVAAGAGINPAFWPHLGSLIVLGRVCKPPPEMPENPLLAAQRGVMNLSDYEFGLFAHL